MVMVYLTKSQRDSRALFLALPCRKCGCGIRATTKEEKDEKDGLGVDAHARTKACKRLLQERLQEEGAAAAGGAAAAAGASAPAAAASPPQQQQQSRRDTFVGACVGVEHQHQQEQHQQEQHQQEQQEQLKAAHAVEVERLKNALRQHGACVQLTCSHAHMLTFSLSHFLTFSLPYCAGLRGADRASSSRKTRSCYKICGESHSVFSHFLTFSLSHFLTFSLSHFLTFSLPHCAGL